MELNVQLVKKFSDIHTIVPMDSASMHNIFKLSAGLCHSSRLVVELNDVELDQSQYLGIYPSSEFKVRYGIDSISAVMLLDNTLRGQVVIKSCPIGGVYQDVNLDKVPSRATVAETHGFYLEDVGEIVGLTSFNTRFEKIPSRATDIGGVLVGVTSYPGSGDTGNYDDLEKRVARLESISIHDDANLPVINVGSKALLISDRAKPLIQFTTDTPNSTWYLDKAKGDITVSLNSMTGEITWVDATVPAGLYTIGLYAMANGIRSTTNLIQLNVV